MNDKGKMTEMIARRYGGRAKWVRRMVARIAAGRADGDTSLTMWGISVSVTRGDGASYDAVAYRVGEDADEFLLDWSFDHAASRLQVWYAAAKELSDALAAAYAEAHGQVSVETKE